MISFPGMIFILLLTVPSQVPQADQIAALRDRITLLEANKLRPTVDSVLSLLRAIMAKTGQNFAMDEALDCLIDLKATAYAEKHEKLPHFSAVYEALKHKMSAPLEQFRRYLIALLGDKAKEKVFDILAKVDKTLKLDAELSSKRGGYERRPQKLPASKQLRCYYCGTRGHLQNRCFKKQRDEAREKMPSLKRPRRDESIP